MYHRNLTDARSKLESSDEKVRTSKSTTRRFRSRLKTSERSAQQNLGKYIQNNENNSAGREFKGSFQNTRSTRANRNFNAAQEKLSNSVVIAENTQSDEDNYFNQINIKVVTEDNHQQHDGAGVLGSRITSPTFSVQNFKSEHTT